MYLYYFALRSQDGFIAKPLIREEIEQTLASCCYPWYM